MKLFKCQNCGQVLYFENTRCESCGYPLGYLSQAMTISALEPDGDLFRALAAPDRPVRMCDNAVHDACNWLVDTDGTTNVCLACRHNRVIPDLTIPLNLERWKLLERAKHHLFYSLLRLRLPLANRIDDPEHGLAFDFLADTPDTATPKVMTGHDNGLITIALAEADDAERERRRTQMNEPYRSLLGHFRHEVGHYFWDVLVRDGGRLEDCRAVFGDDSQDYDLALQTHYKSGPQPNWQENYVSRYASTHPWEDWAETWAHYLHSTDTLEIAAACGLALRPAHAAEPSLKKITVPQGEGRERFDKIAADWHALTYVLNNLNRSLGQADAYPFILSAPALDKLRFVHDTIAAA
jgi:hypothetical protein